MMTRLACTPHLNFSIMIIKYPVSCILYPVFCILYPVTRETPVGQHLSVVTRETPFGHKGNTCQSQWKHLSVTKETPVSHKGNTRQSQGKHLLVTRETLVGFMMTRLACTPHLNFSIMIIKYPVSCILYPVFCILYPVTRETPVGQHLSVVTRETTSSSDPRTLGSIPQARQGEG